MPVKTHRPDNMFVPEFSSLEEISRILIKYTPGKQKLFELMQNSSVYHLYVPVFYTMSTPLLQIIWGSHNVHFGIGDTAVPHTKEDWVSSQEALTSTLGRYLGLSANHTVLDVGSGVGGPAAAVAGEFQGNVRGLNITQAHINKAERLIADKALQDKVEFTRGDAMAMPFQDAQFDHAYAIESMSHMPDKQKLLTEVARVTRPGARFGMCDVCTDDVEAMSSHPDFGFFNAIFAIRPEDWMVGKDIPSYFENAKFKVAIHEDVTEQVLALRDPLEQFVEERKQLIGDLYGKATFTLAKKCMDVGFEFLDKRLLRYLIVVGEKA